MLRLVDKDAYQAKIKFNVPPSQLYHIRKQSEINNLLIEYLTRAFTGVFNDYITLSEYKLSKALKAKFSVIHAALLNLSSQGVLHVLSCK